jgi:adenylate cyclase
MNRDRWASWRRRRALLLLVVGLGATGLSIAAFAGHVLQGPELQVIDAHFSVRGPTHAASDVAVVGIDATTFDRLGRPWPFPRRLHAKVINRLRRDGAKVIAYDVQFTEATDPADDQALANSIFQAGNVVLGTSEVDPRGHVAILGGDRVLRELHAGWGDTSVKPDGDGIFRRLYYSLQGLRSFAVAAAQRATGRPTPRSSFPGGSVPIDFAGRPGTVPTVSFSSVLQGTVPASFFRGKVVVVGATAPTLQDVHQTAASRSELMAGPEIQANAISTILRGFPLQDAAGWLDLLLIVLLGMAVPLVNLRLRSWRVGALAVTLGIGYTVATQIAFDNGLIITFAYPLLALLLATVGAMGADYLFTAFEHQRTRDTFSRFVPDAVVEDVLARAGEDLRLGGMECICTVMFCDLRGFTSFSETLTANQVIAVVNFYLDQMTAAILEAGGTLVSYAGDGIMAVFGAPLSQPDHADRAVLAAREMMASRLDRFNAWLRQQDFDHDGFRMGIGLNSGLVMSGMVGSERRVEYTAIGDTTNTASRLEGMTKGSGHMLLLSEATRALLMETPKDLIRVGELEIRGRRARMSVWTIPDPPGALPDPSAAPPAATEAELPDPVAALPAPEAPEAAAVHPD